MGLDSPVPSCLPVGVPLHNHKARFVQGATRGYLDIVRLIEMRCLTQCHALAIRPTYAATAQ